MSLIISFDPGLTTGIAVCVDGKIDTLMLRLDNVMYWLDDYTPEVVIVERYITSARVSRYGLWTIDLVGQIKGWCLARGVKCVPLTPMSRKAWLDKGEQLGGKRVIHERDALGHLLHYLDNNHLLYTMEIRV